MKRNIIIFSTAVMLVSMLASCLKTIDPLMETSNTITVNFVNSGPNFLTSSVEVNPKDSIKFNFSVTCPGTMKYVSIVKNGITSDIVKDVIAPNADHHSFSAIKKFVADSIPGSYYYKVIARDTLGVYLGSSDPIIVTVKPDFVYYTNKRLFVPDTTAKTNQTYYNLVLQTAYSYTDIVTNKNSDKIDMGFFFDPTILSGTTPKGFSIYNLTGIPTGQLAFYDISTFTKNVTLFKLYTATSWANTNSGGLLKAQCATNFKTVTAANYYLNSLASGSIVLFKTAAGRCGAFTLTYVKASSASSGTYINFEVKLAN